MDGLGDADSTLATWGVWAAGGVMPGPAPAWLDEAEAASPARRSPRVRAAQAAGTRRPDRLPRQPSDT